MDTVEDISSLKSPADIGNPSHYGYIYSAERPQPQPEVGWTDKQNDEQKISLYSENVVKEGETSESVDRESIANLSSTKKQWETIFSSSGQADTPVRKKSTPRWEVRLPYTEKPSAPVVTSGFHQNDQTSGRETDESEDQKAMFRKSANSESAIEREIRLSHEREEMLRREKEERQKVMTPGQTIIASYEGTSAESESYQPAYNELAEADRRPDLWGVDDRRKREEESENDNGVDVNPNESIIEREIRLQREREADVARMRRQSSNVAPQQEQQHHQQLSAPKNYYQAKEEISKEADDVNHNQMKGVNYESSVANASHEEESLIARELRELREREEEIKRLHSSFQQTQISDEVDGPTQTNTPAPKPSSLSAPPLNSPVIFSQGTQSPGQGTWQRDVSPFVSQNRRESVDSASSHSTGRTPSDSTPSRRDVKVQPIADGHGKDDENENDNRNYFQKQETPIEREMRLARERENELRRVKGLPELIHNDAEPYDSYGATTESNTNNTLSRPRSIGQPGDTMKKFASSRLQQELQQQKERELVLRREGKILSTSEEHIQPLKYTEIAGVDKVDGKEKRNFVTKKTSVSYSESDTPTTPGESTATPTPRKTSVAAGGNLFSYKEFKQTAESKIERELREMRGREEELRMQRSGTQGETAQ